MKKYNEGKEVQSILKAWITIGLPIEMKKYFVRKNGDKERIAKRNENAICLEKNWIELPIEMKIQFVGRK